MPNNTESKKIKSVGRAFDIIESIHRLDKPGVTAIANNIDVSKSTVHAHLTALLERGYLIQDDGYRLSLKFLMLGGYLQQSADYRKLYKIAKPEIEELAQQTGERAALMVEENGKGYFFYVVEGQRAVSTDSHIGWQLPLHSTACGKSYLSELSRESVNEILDKQGMPALTDSTITDRETLHNQLDEIRRQGIAFDKGERLPGIYCIGVPVTTETGDLLGSISVSLPSNRADSVSFRTELPEKISNAARVIGLNSTYT